MKAHNLSLYLRLAILQIKNRPKFALLFALNMAIGLSGITLVDGFKNAFISSSTQRSQNAASADILISARRNFDPEELKSAQHILQDDLKAYSHRIRMYSMPLLWDMKKSQPKENTPPLVELHFIDKNFPLYGQITLDGEQSLQNVLQDTSIVLVASDTAKKWNIQPQDQLKIGEKIYTVGPIILEDSASNALSGQLAPRIYLSRLSVHDTQLIQKGSSVWHDHLYALSSSQHHRLDTLTEKLRDAIDHPSTSISSHIENTERSGRLFSYFTHFLSLVGMVAFFLSCIGIHFLFRYLMLSRIRDIATLTALGLGLRQAILPLLFELVILSSIAAISVFAVCIALGHGILLLTSTWILQDLSFHLGILDFILLWILACLGALLLSLPAIYQIIQLPLTQLLSQSVISSALSSKKKQQIYAWIPAFILLFGASLLKSSDIQLGCIFFAILCASTLFFWGLARIVTRILPHHRPSQSLVWKIADLWIHKSPTYWNLSFITLALTVMLITIIPLLRSHIQQSLTPPSSPPSLFFLDIQPEQLSEVESALQEFDVLQNWKSAPFILVKLTAINDKPFTRSESGEEDAVRRMRERAMRLSYTDTLNSSEQIIAGKFFSGTWDPQLREIPELSLTQQFAERIGAQLGDILTFDITGITVQGEITSLRKVHWLSLQPNFFILFQPGVVEQAPKTYIGSLSSIQNASVKHGIQSRITQTMPNISMIDVEGAVKLVKDLIEQISLGLWLMSWVSIIAGWLIFWCTVQHSLQRRKKHMALLLALGTTHRTLNLSLIAEYTVLAISSTLTGGCIALLVQHIIAEKVLSLESSTSFIVSISYPLGISFIATLFTIIIAALIIRSTLKEPVRDMLT